MKAFLTLVALLVTFACCTASCSKGEETIASLNNNNENTSSSTMKITIGTAVFSATLYDNASANSFKARLPLTLDMRELNGNEKYFDLANSLPTNASPSGSIKVGDLTLYGDKTLVLFYKNFNTSYSYTRLGAIDNPTGLAAALGTGNVVVKFEQN